MIRLFTPKHKKTPKLSPLSLTVALRRGEDGYIIADCLQLPGCMSQGRNQQEARRNIVAAIEECLAIRMQEFVCESTATMDLVGIEAKEVFVIRPPQVDTSFHSRL